MKESLELDVLGLGIFYTVSTKLHWNYVSQKSILHMVWVRVLEILMEGMELEGKSEAATIFILGKSDAVAAQGYCWQPAS